jgi:hypothetical protein
MLALCKSIQLVPGHARMPAAHTPPFYAQGIAWLNHTDLKPTLGLMLALASAVNHHAHLQPLSMSGPPLQLEGATALESHPGDEEQAWQS